MKHERVTLSNSRQQFFGAIHRLSGIPLDQLMAIARDRTRFSLRTRAAALRHVVSLAPITVTRGMPYAARRRLVRNHYRV